MRVRRLPAVVTLVGLLLVQAACSSDSSELGSGEIVADDGSTRSWKAELENGEVCVDIADGASACHPIPADIEPGGLATSVVVASASIALVGVAPRGTTVVRVVASPSSDPLAMTVADDSGQVAFAQALGFMEDPGVIVLEAIDSDGEVLGTTVIEPRNSS